MENRIMMRLSFIECPYPRVAEIYRLLDTIGLDVTILPNVDRGRGAFLVLPKNDLKKARDACDRWNIRAECREVVILNIDNKIGAIADISRKIKDAGVSIRHAFLAPLSMSEAFLVLECSDNKLALRSIERGPDCGSRASHEESARRSVEAVLKG